MYNYLTAKLTKMNVIYSPKYLIKNIKFTSKMSIKKYKICFPKISINLLSKNIHQISPKYRTVLNQCFIKRAPLRNITAQKLDNNFLNINLHTLKMTAQEVKFKIKILEWNDVFKISPTTNHLLL